MKSHHVFSASPAPKALLQANLKEVKLAGKPQDKAKTQDGKTDQVHFAHQSTPSKEPNEPKEIAPGILDRYVSHEQEPILVPKYDATRYRMLKPLYYVNRFIPIPALRRWIEGKMMFFQCYPVKLTDMPAHERDRIQPVSFMSGKNKLEGWYIPPKEGKPTVLVTNGNAGNLLMTHMLIPYTDKGYGALVFNYRGYGNSQGKPTEQGVYDDAQAASDYLAKEHHTPVEQQILYGVSMGGAVAVHTAQNKPYKAVILNGTFSSFADQINTMLFNGEKKGLKTELKFDSLSKIKNIHSPLLLTHGTYDDLISMELSHKLYEASPSKKKAYYSLHNEGHNYRGSVRQPLADVTMKFIEG